MKKKKRTSQTLKQQEKKTTKYALLFLFFSLTLFILFFVFFGKDIFVALSPPQQEADIEIQAPPPIQSPVNTSIPTAIPSVTPAVFVPTLTATIAPLPSPTIEPQPTYPVSEAFSIGKSVNGRDIEMYRFGDGGDIRLIVGAIHGGYEWNTADLLFALVKNIQEEKIQIPDNITLYILPALNVDGYYEYRESVYGRANANGVDINRNWDAFWQETWSKEGCFAYAELTAGTVPFSEPETRALADFITQNNVSALISYHSAMASIFAGGRPEPDPKSDELAIKLAEVSGYSYPPNDGGTCEYTGQLIDWASLQGIAAVDIELTDHQNLDHDINRKVLEAFLVWQPESE